METAFEITFKKIGNYNIVTEIILPTCVCDVIGYTSSDAYAIFDKEYSELELKCPCLKLPIYIKQGDHYTDVQMDFIKINLKLVASNFLVYLENGYGI